MPEGNQLPGIQVLSIGKIEQLAQAILPCNRPFTLFLAWDAPDVDREQLENWLRPLVEHGLGYFCAWGEQCEEVHDAVDRCDIAHLKGDLRPDSIVITTWYNEESLEDAFEFFVYCAEFSAIRDITDFDRFAVAVGNPHWEAEMQRFLAKQPGIRLLNAIG